MNALAQIQPDRGVDMYRVSTDAASVCKDIVVATASMIQGRKFVSVEGWQAIAIAHGCAAGARDVEKIEGGVRAIGEIRRMSDGAILSTAEGFVGEDEETWYGGTNRYGKALPKRNDYAIRAMAQTRAISRACRSAFAHVVVMMNAGLSTTPAEEVPEGGFDNAAPAPAAKQTVESRPAPKQEQAPSTITNEQRSILLGLAEKGNVSVVDICAKAKIASVKDLPAARFDGCLKWIEGIINGSVKRPAPAAASDILDDEIPY